MSVRSFDGEWFAALDVVLRADPEYAVISRHLDRRVGFVCGQQASVVHFHSGGVDEFMSGPSAVARADFGFRAEPDVWDRFLLPTPPPLFQDLFALIARVQGFRVIGDELALMQNIRAVQRAMRLLREVRV